MNKLRQLEIKDHSSINLNLYIDSSEQKFIKIYKSPESLELVERNINFIKEKNCFNPNILDIYYDEDGNFIGYSQDYITNARTFLDGLSDSELSFEKKYKYICDIFESLKKLHSFGAHIGDIHSRNLIYDDEDAYIIDFDDIRFSQEDNLPLSEYYYIQYSSNYNYQESSMFTDNIKATISALSLLYGFDFEEIAIMHSISTLVSYLELFISDDNLLNDIKEIFYNKDTIIYFDDVLKKYFASKLLIKD